MTSRKYVIGRFSWCNASDAIDLSKWCELQSDHQEPIVLDPVIFTKNFEYIRKQYRFVLCLRLVRTLSGVGVDTETWRMQILISPTSLTTLIMPDVYEYSYEWIFIQPRRVQTTTRWTRTREETAKRETAKPAKETTAKAKTMTMTTQRAVRTVTWGWIRKDLPPDLEDSLNLTHRTKYDRFHSRTRCLCSHRRTGK